MKKLVFGLVAALMTTVSFGQSKATLSSNVKTDSKSESRIHIEFGRKSKGCGGIGICVFTIDITIEEALDIITAIATKDGKIKAKFSNDFYAKRLI